MIVDQLAGALTPVAHRGVLRGAYDLAGHRLSGSRREGTRWRAIQWARRVVLARAKVTVGACLAHVTDRRAAGAAGGAARHETLTGDAPGRTCDTPPRRP